MVVETTLKTHNNNKKENTQQKLAMNIRKLILFSITIKIYQNCNKYFRELSTYFGNTKKLLIWTWTNLIILQKEKTSSAFYISSI